MQRRRALNRGTEDEARTSIPRAEAH
jgi:hypothetical protein